MRLTSNPSARLARARASFVVFRGATGVRRRAAAIRRRRQKRWRGVHVFEVRCAGPFGRGPHHVFVPEFVLWSLIDLRHFLCPFHR
jgi:hypothetical protein